MTKEPSLLFIRENVDEGGAVSAQDKKETKGPDRCLSW